MYLHILKIENFRKFYKEQELIFAHKIEKNMGTDECTEDETEQEFNVASDLTLIIGKNNSGKTTVINAINKLIGKESFNEQDFNYLYLAKLLEQYNDQNFDELPKIRFKILVGSDDSQNDKMTNIFPFVKKESYEKDTEKDSIYTIIATYEPKEEEKLRKNLETNIQNDLSLMGLLEIIKNSKYRINYYREDKQVVENFNIRQLIEMQFIEANQLKEEEILSKSFSKIFDSNLKNNAETDTTESIDKDISSFNEKITGIANEEIAKDTKESLENMIHSSNMSMELSGSLERDSLFSQAIKYSFSEDGYSIPEKQYGLGYINLVTIIARIIDYIELYQEKAFQSKINILSIEEPETFMHPQMQELFIKNINSVVNTVLKSLGKDVHLQIIVTTHSSHLINSKLKSSQALDYINYLTYSDQGLKAIPLNNANVLPETVRDEYKTESKKFQNELRFLMTHLTYKTSELFFADAIIFVEGPTEENIVRYYIDNSIEYESLSKFYITIFNIDGAHAHRYAELIKTLQIPCVIMTDLDIKRDSKSKKNMTNIKLDELNDSILTTNTTLKFYLNRIDCAEYPKILEICTQDNHVFEEDNLRVYTQQKEIEGYLATSFEEAVILTNYENEILNDVLKSTRSGIYKDIAGEPVNLEHNKHNSYKWQIKLSEEKTKFANNLLFILVQNRDKSESELPKLPDYIHQGLKFLDEKLNIDDSQEVE